MRQLDLDVAQRALDEGLITAADKQRVDRLVADAQKQGVRLHAAQALVRERLISCADLLRLQDGQEARLYECPHCRHRHARADLPKKQRQRFACKGCKRPLELERAELSRLEVLASRDPLDLSVPLHSVSESSASALSEIDLDRYEVHEELGRGGYGVVFKAVQKDLEREVALKVLRAGADLPPVSLERFVREGRAVSRLKHPNIVTVYDIGRQRDLFAMSMEYVRGDPLRNVVRARGSLPWREAAEMMVQVLDGIEHAHGLGIIHRDLKTNNILVEAETGRPRIIDFGLAKDLGADSALTQGGAIVGTPNYLSPEQIQGRSSEADARADIFALGVIFYELLCGKRPFESKQKAEVYKKILTEAPRPILEMTVDGSGKSPVPPALAAVVHRALEKRADDRFQTAAEMRAAIQAALSGDAPPPGTKTDRKRRTGAHARPRPTTRSMAAVQAAPGGVSPALVGGALAGVLLLELLVGFRPARRPAAPVADARPVAPPPPAPVARRPRR
ncbi:MAG: protein kinase [Planctomycetes bacterium]|nr:protein kinase [Planctomycetota bacterium]